MTLGLLCGALAGLGCYAFIRVWLRPRPGVARLVNRIDSGTKSMFTHTVTQFEADARTSRVDSLAARMSDRLEVFAVERGWRLRRVRSDLAIMNQTVGGFLATKVIYGLGLLLLAPVLWTVLRLGGIGLPAQIPALAAIVLGAFGFFIPDLSVRGEAEKRRNDFRRIVSIFLDLVAMNLAGGRGLPEALLTASTISENWALIRIRQALANARLFGTTPWAALGDLGREIGVDELSDLAAALTLASDDGAKIRQSLAARAATMRRRELSDVEGEAGEKSQSMLVAQLVICSGFMIFLAYPAIAQLVKQ